MDAPAIVLAAVAGVLAGRVVVTIVERVPDPEPVPLVARVALVIGNGALWALAARTFTTWWAVVPIAGFFSMLLVASAIDMRTYRIPDRIVFPSLAASVPLLAVCAYGFTTDFGETREWMISGGVGALGYFVLLFIPHLIYPKGMGFGDVKLAAVMGLYLGWAAGGDNVQAVYFALVALMIGCVLGVVIGLGVNVIRRKGGAFPFGPALALAAVVVLVDLNRFLLP